LGCVEEATQARDARASSVPPPSERTTPGLCIAFWPQEGAVAQLVVIGGEGAACVHADVEAGPGEHRNRDDRSRRDHGAVQQVGGCGSRREP